ncbi:MAG: MerR family transcriptional regulator [Alphaproteobacteria bacterium]
MTAPGNFTIGWLAGQTNCKVQTIRYYEQIALLPTPPRSSGNRRLYGQRDADRLAFIRHARDLGFSLDAIRDLLSLSDTPDRTCAAADKLASAHLVDVNSRIARLEALKTELERMVEQCSGGKISSCRVIEVLADHSKCVSRDHANA